MPRSESVDGSGVETVAATTSPAVMDRIRLIAAIEVDHRYPRHPSQHRSEENRAA